MTGVEILNQETIYNTIIPEYWLAIGFFGFIVFLFLTFIWLTSDHMILYCIFFILTIGCMILGMLSDVTSKDIDYIKYEVLIDDSVSITEFMDKYEILEQRGRIYTVKEKSE